MNGIYQIKNLINDKVYVGSSANINKRWGQHIALLNSNKHNNEHLQRAWNKCGKENFSFSILEKVEKEDNIFIKEKDWIIKLDSIDPTKGYNKAIPNENGSNPMSDEGKERVILAIIKKARNIIVLKKETGEFLGEYESIGLVVKALNFPNNKKVSEVLNKQRVAYKDYIFVYKEDYDPNKDYSLKKGHHHISTRKPVYQYDLNMNLVKEWDTPQEIVNELNIKLSSLYTCLSRKDVLFGFYWRRNLEKEKSIKKEKEWRGV